jgi:hypothetical protein
VLPAAQGAASTFLSNDGAGNLSWQTPAAGGKILQVVQASTTTQVSVATTTYTDTTLTATITPTSVTSQILVMVSQQTYATRTGNANGLGVRLLRDATVIFTPPTDATGPYISYIGAGTFVQLFNQVNFQVLDSPATTSPVTYKTQGRPYTILNSGSATFQNAGVVAGTSFITLFEVEP